MDDDPQTISSLIGREVYTTSGIFVGEVEDIDLNLETRAAEELAISPVNTDLFGLFADGYQGVGVPYRWVRSVGDIILVSDAVERLKETQARD